MRGLLLFALCFANLNDIWSPDVLPNALLPFTLLREGNVSYDEFVFRPAERNASGAPTASPGVQPIGGDRLDSEAYFFRACGVSTAAAPPTAPRSRGGPPAPGPNDHVCSVFPPGMGLLALPLFLPFVLAGANALDLGLLIRVGHVAAAFYETIAALLLWAALRRYASERQALLLVLLYWLGTSVRTVSSQALWQHAGVHLAVAFALWVVLRPQWISARREALAGFALGLGGMVRQTTAFVALGTSGARARAWLVTLGAAIAGLIPLAVWNWIVLGSPFEQGYGEKPFDTPMLQGLDGLLLSPSRGLFVYEPWTVLALVSFAIAYFAQTTRGPISVRLSFLVVPWLALVAVYATYAEWWGGRVFGPRFLDDLAPVLVAVLGWGVRQGFFAFGPLKWALWISAAWSVLLFNAAAFVYSQALWDTVPVNVNDDPSRLFSWSDPQWLAVLRELPNGGPKVIVAIALTALVLLFLARVEGLIGRRVASPA
jgi:hypothetical protein